MHNSYNIAFLLFTFLRYFLVYFSVTKIYCYAKRQYNFKHFTFSSLSRQLYPSVVGLHWPTPSFDTCILFNDKRWFSVLPFHYRQTGVRIFKEKVGHHVSGNSIAIQYLLQFKCCTLKSSFGPIEITTCNKLHFPRHAFFPGVLWIRSETWHFSTVHFTFNV